MFCKKLIYLHMKLFREDIDWFLSSVWLLTVSLTKLNLLHSLSVESILLNGCLRVESVLNFSLAVFKLSFVYCRHKDILSRSRLAKFFLFWRTFLFWLRWRYWCNILVLGTAGWSGCLSFDKHFWQWSFCVWRFDLFGSYCFLWLYVGLK